MNRRKFIRSGVVAAAMLSASRPAFASGSAEGRKLTILHTNDVHSHIEPFPMDGSPNQGLGGVARRAALINQIRAEEGEILLLDAGDIFQGTPYFNFYGGEIEMKLMSKMGYDGATIGNHDLDNGIEGFYRQLPHASFPIIISNYELSNTLLHRSTVPYTIFKRNGLRIGVFGIGIELEGLVDKRNYDGIVYLDPIASANLYAERLRNDHKCDLVICLSHLGYNYKDNKVSDRVLAAQTRNIDLIIGGHTHTFLAHPEDIKNLDGQLTTVNQVGWGGINLGRIDYSFNKEGAGANRSSRVYQIIDKSG